MSAPRLSRPAKAALFAGSALVVVMLLAAVAGIFVLRSEWLRETLRKTIITELEKVTGGRVELATFHFDWSSLTAEVKGLVVHGKEPAGDPPLLAVDRVAIQLKIISLIRKEFDLSAITIEHPQARVILYPDGSTNVPEPKVKTKSKKPVPETILDLKIGSFILTAGDAVAETPKGKRKATGFQTRAQNLAIHLAYDAAALRYAGDLQLAPLHFDSKDTGPMDLTIQTQIAMEKNRLLVSKAQIKSKLADVILTDFVMDNFTDPVFTSDVNVKASMTEVGRLAGWTSHQAGTAILRGKGRFVSLSNYELAGAVHCDSFDFSTGSKRFNLPGSRVDSRYVIRPDKVDLEGIKIVALGGTVSGKGVIKNWAQFQSEGKVDGITMRNILGTFTKYQLPYDTAAAGPYEVHGDFYHIADTQIAGTFNLLATKNSAPVTGVANLTYNGTADELKFTQSSVNLPYTRVDVSGILDKQFQVSAFSTNPEDLLPFFGVKSIPVSLKNGSATFVGTITGDSLDPVIQGHAEAKNLAYSGQVANSATGDFTIDHGGVRFANGRVNDGALTAQTDGSLAWKYWTIDDHGRLEARIQVKQADFGQLLAMANSSDVQLKGFVDATAQITGDLANPKFSGDLRAGPGSYSGEPFDSIIAHVDSPTAASQTAVGEITAGNRTAKLQLRFDHAADHLLPGTMNFHVETNKIALGQVQTFRSQVSQGNADAILKADGTAILSEDAKKVTHIRFSKLDGDLNISNIDIAGRRLGEMQVHSVTRNDVMTARLTSNLAGAQVQGDATIQLAGDYLMQSHISIAKIDLNTIWKLANPETAAGSFNFGGAAEAVLNLAGPLTKSDQISGSLEIPRFELRPLPAAGSPRTLQTLMVKNAGTLRARLAQSVVRLEDFRLEAPNTNLALTGTIALQQKTPLDLRAQGKVDLKILEGFNPDLSSTGELNLNATLRGTFDSPDFAGRAQLTGGDFHLADFSNGLTNAAGSIVFNGSRATIQSLTAESGGGKVDATGFIAVIKGLLAFNLETRLTSVRVRYPEGVSTVADANITVAGTSQRSQASGLVSIRRMTINPKSEAGGILAKSVEPVRTPSASTGLLANLNLDVQVETAPDVALQTSLAQTLQAEASLRLRGTATNPALLGRVAVTEGEIVFFGNKYTITQGTISFFNPVRVEPILNVDLETKARGVQIIISVSGPIDKPLNVTYRSDPPLQFSDIVALLATGRSPTDPSIALRDSGGNQSLQQMGASALLGQAIANPVSGRLQRFFGVSKLKIDPQLSGITGSPQARLTIEQQITPDILFTYITDVSSTSTQLIRVEWAFDKTWSAILTREENGYVGLDFAYKKRFK